MRTENTEPGRFACRWCDETRKYFVDLETHANDAHPVEFERAITKPRLTTVEGDGRGN